MSSVTVSPCVGSHGRQYIQETGCTPPFVAAGGFTRCCLPRPGLSPSPYKELPPLSMVLLFLNSGSGRHVFRQLLPLPALQQLRVKRQYWALGALSEATDPKKTQQPVQLSGSSGKEGHTHPPCACRGITANTGPFQLTQGPFHVPPTQTCQSKGNKE